MDELVKFTAPKESSKANSMSAIIYSGLSRKCFLSQCIRKEY